jgi:hypothetical protein
LLKTGRGNYAIASVGPLEQTADSVVLTVSLERADGIEKIALRFRISTALIGDTNSPEKLIERITPWLEREFEQTREAALKSIRTERKLLEISFDADHRGPFA